MLLRRRLEVGDRPSMAELAQAIGVSRGSLYRRFPNRHALLRALGAVEDPRVTLVDAAAELVEQHGADRLSLDELAAVTGMRRATIYRWFPGRSALLAAVMETYVPNDVVATLAQSAADRPLEEFAEVLATGMGERFARRPRLLRALLHEATRTSEDQAAVGTVLVQAVIAPLTAELARHLERCGRPDLDPVLAAQALVGPLILHVLSRELLQRHGVNLPATEDSASVFSTLWLTGVSRPERTDDPVRRR